MSSFFVAVTADDSHILRDRKALFRKFFRKPQSHKIIGTGNGFRKPSVTSRQALRQTLPARVPEISVEDLIFIDPYAVISERIFICVQSYD